MAWQAVVSEADNRARRAMTQITLAALNPEPSPPPYNKRLNVIIFSASNSIELITSDF